MEKGALATLVLTLAVVLGAAGVILPGQLNFDSDDGNSYEQTPVNISSTLSTTTQASSSMDYVITNTTPNHKTEDYNRVRHPLGNHGNERHDTEDNLGNEHAGPMGPGMMGEDMGHNNAPSGHGPSLGRAAGMEEGHDLGVCANDGRYSPQENIMWLLQNHDLFDWSRMEFPDNRTIVWEIIAATPEAAERLYEHILQMKCILDNGGTPRAMDPVFRLESMVYEYIDTNVTLVNDTMLRVVKTGANACAYEVVRLHADVVEGFFERGMDEARRTHPVPDDVLAECEKLVGDIDLSNGMDMHGRGMRGGGH